MQSVPTTTSQVEHFWAPGYSLKALCSQSPPLPQAIPTFGGLGILSVSFIAPSPALRTLEQCWCLIDVCWLNEGNNK